MDYQQTLDYLYHHLPMFSRIGDKAIKKDLANTIELCHFLGDPQHKFKAIHIAGTNGKGSVAHMLASILQEAGYKTGLYTSPHLIDFRERIRVNGKPCTEKFVTQFTEKVKPMIETIQPSFFEITVAMAFDYFAKKKVDIAVIETGLGGRLDSTNVIRPLLSVITNISYDHQAILGNTLPEIAREKAGIIKHFVPALIGRRSAETDTVFSAYAETMQAPLAFAEDLVQELHAVKTERFLIVDAQVNGEPVNICCDLQALYQEENVRTVLAAIALIRKYNLFPLKEKAVQVGFSRVRKNTHLLGRWQVLETHPKVVADVAHNEDGWRKMLAQLATESYHQLHIVFGAVKDKDINTILDLLPLSAHYYFTEPPLPRKLDARELKEMAAAKGLNGLVCPHPKDALGVAKSKAGEQDLILVTGSFFVVAEVL